MAKVYVINSESWHHFFFLLVGFFWFVVVVALCALSTQRIYMFLCILCIDITLSFHFCFYYFYSCSMCSIPEQQTSSDVHASVCVCVCSAVSVYVCDCGICNIHAKWPEMYAWKKLNQINNIYMDRMNVICVVQNNKTTKLVALNALMCTCNRYIVWWWCRAVCVLLPVWMRARVYTVQPYMYA